MKCNCTFFNQKTQFDIYGGPQLSQQYQIAHRKSKRLTAKPKSSRQNQKTHVKSKKLSAKKQKAHGKNKKLTFGPQKLRKGDSKYREFASKTELSDFFIFCQEKPFGELFSKIRLKLSKEFSFLRNPTKSGFAAFALRPPLNSSEKMGKFTWLSEKNG